MGVARERALACSPEDRVAASCIRVLNGPNLNLLGSREPSIYGMADLADLQAELTGRARELACAVEFEQHNGEGELVSAVHRAGLEAQGIILNPGALAHYGYSLRDAVASVSVPTVEVHISNVFAREPFRRRLVVAPATMGVVVGLGVSGYRVALEALVAHLHRSR